MPLTSSTRLGPYEILSALGAGGMGEVYRARDTRLGREVAIKVLPQHLSANAEVRARFEREAKTVSSLNHPHICTLFDIGSENGTDYLVMELIEGETLAARLTKGALPAADVLRLGAQIADALDRAHRAGVIHRDLKPGNVMLTRSGAKLMDFGLARATGLQGPGASGGISVAALTESPTIAQPLTTEGTIVGTYQYMAPEQLEGGEADARSDLWSLGCVLYEMATGRRAFDGRSQASLISAIMGSEPPPVSQVAPLAPAALDRLIRNCLAKDPDDRIQTAHDVKLRLIGIAEGDSAAAGTAAPTAPARPASALPWAVAALFALIAAGLGVVMASRGMSPRRAVQLSLVAPEQTRLGVYASTAAIAPNGDAVAFFAVDTSGVAGVWLQRLDAPDAVRIATTAGLTFPFWSPDSRWLGLLDAAGGKLMTFRMGGGSPSTIHNVPFGAGRGATWSRKGVIVCAPRAQGPLQRISAAGGGIQQVTWLDSTRNEAGHRFPFFLPDGDHFLYVALPGGPDGADVFVGSLSSRRVKKILTAESAPTYAEPGYLLFRRTGKVMAQRFDVRALELRGDPVAIADAPTAMDIDLEPVASASRDGRLLHLVDGSPDRQLEWFDRTGTPRGTLSLPDGNWGPPSLSHDDRFAIAARGGDLWRVDLARSVAVRLSSGAIATTNPTWSPDDRRIAFAAGRGSDQIFEVPSDGSGEPRLLTTTTDLFKWPESWPAPGLVFLSIGMETNRDLWMLPASGGPAVPLIRTQFSEFLSEVSPDGRWIAYLSNEAGTEDVYIQSFPEPGHKVRVSSTGALRLWWMPGSDELCYRSASNEIVSVKLAPAGEDLQVGGARVLFRLPPDIAGLDLSSDGERFLMSTTRPGAHRRRLRVILDWTALMER